MRSPAKHLAALAAGAVIVAAACTSAPASDNVLRIAMGSPGEAQIRVWDDVAKQFEAANPGTPSSSTIRTTISTRRSGSRTC